MAKKKQEKQDTTTITIAGGGSTIKVDAADAERILSREWTVYGNEYITTFTNGSELLGNFILGLPMTVFIEQVNKADVFNHTRSNLRPYVHRPGAGRETR